MCPACLLFLFLSVRYIESPGVYYDEALQANTAVYLTQKKVETGHCSAWDWEVGGLTIPLMCGEYTGAVKSYVLAPAFYLFGSTAAVMRLTMVMVALLGVLWTMGFARRAGGDSAGVFAVWLVATDPGLIILARNDWGPVAIAFALRMAALYYLLRWWKSGGRRIYLVLAAALMGLGVWDKTSFLWIMVALGIAGVYVWLVNRGRPRLTAKDAAMASIAWLTTSLPLWVYNLGFDWITFRLVKMPGQKVTLMDLIGFMPRRTEDLLKLMSGGSVAEWMFGKPLPATMGLSETILAPMAMAAAIVFLAICLWQRKWSHLGLLLLTAILIAEIYATPRHVSYHHWIGIYPLPQLLIGLACGICWQEAMKMRSPARVAIGGLLLAALLGTIGANLAVMRGYHQLMREEGGAGMWNDAIYPLADLLKRKYADREIRVLDWGVTNQLMMLSSGQLKLREHFDWQPNRSRPSEEFARLLRDPVNVFLIPTEQALAQDAGTQLQMVAAQAGMTLKTAEQILDRRREVAYTIYAYEPAVNGGPHGADR